MSPFILIWLVLVFLLGATVGSFLNVCIHRLPYEKSIFWPLSSRCGNCLQQIRWYDNLPLLSYWVLRGRCRACKSSFSMRYFIVELFTALSFLGLFYVEVILNVHQLQCLKDKQFLIQAGVIPAEGWIFFVYHAILISFLIVVSGCDLEHQEIPMSIPLTGMCLGLLGGVLFPWPWPYSPLEAAPNPAKFALGWAGGANLGPRLALQPWPAWYPLPAWLDLGGNWQTGLITALAGMLMGTAALRAVRFVFGVGRGIEGLGLGDADLMLMCGSFLGWQIVLIGFFVAVVPGLFFGILQLVKKGDQALPFGPSLAMGVVITWLCWRWIGPWAQPLLFDGMLMPLLGIVGGLFLLVAGFLLGAFRGGEPESPPAV